MQSLASELRACVLDELDFDRGGTVDDVGARARATVDALLGLAVLDRSWTADAQARLRRVVVIEGTTDLASLDGAGLEASLRVIVDRREVALWSDEVYGVLERWLADGTTREFIGT